MKLLRFGLLLSLIFLSFTIASSEQRGNAAAMNSEIVWEAPSNISNSPEKTSTDPFLLSDPTGKVHLFWAEKVGSIEGNQPDTLMYTEWNGVNWRRPIDLFFSPETSGTPIIAFPHAVIDSNGRIHLFWMAQPNFPKYTLFYSSAMATNAYNAFEWTPERRLVDDLTGTKYSFSVQLRDPNEIHLVFARVQQGFNPPEERAVSYIKSIDNGETWSKSVDIITFNNLNAGASDTRIVVGVKSHIYATWTEWGESGNGQRIWFSRSLDNGGNWEKPVILSERIQNEYERDWAALTVLDEDKIVVMWEGGWRAYRHAQYSDDGGATWSKPIDTFPWLIGENGFVEFARDSNGTLHAFLSQRMREGFSYYGDTDSSALWHSVWEGDRLWSEPELSNGFNPMLNPKVTIFNGNQVMVTWYTSSTLEIMTMLGTIQNAPRIKENLIYIESTAAIPTIIATKTDLPPTAEEQIPDDKSFVDSSDISQNEQKFTSISILLVGVLSVIGLLSLVLLRRKIQTRNH